MPPDRFRKWAQRAGLRAATKTRPGQHLFFMNTNTPQLITKINAVAAALLLAAGAHTFLCLCATPALLAPATNGTLGIIFAAMKLSWTSVGAIAGAYVFYNAAHMIRARSFQKARIAAVGALALPLFGVLGPITAFALLPAGTLAFVLLRQPDWKAAFADTPRRSASEGC
jgi:hypothetical protein